MMNGSENLNGLDESEDLEHSEFADLQLAKEAFHAKKAKLEILRGDFDNLKWQKSKLIRELKLDEERFKRTVEAQNGPNIHQLMELFDAKLPRELRDMVYEHLGISGRRIHLTPPPNDVGFLADWVPHTYNCLFDEKCVTKSVAREIRAFYWSSNTFGVYIDPEVRLQLVEVLTITPGKEHPFSKADNSPQRNIRYLRVNLRCEKWGQCRRCGNLPLGPGCLPYYCCHTIDNLEKNLVSLWCLGGQRQTQVDIILHTNLPKVKVEYDPESSHFQRHWVNMLESIRSCFLFLKHSGTRVKVLMNHASYDHDSATFMPDFDDDNWDITPCLAVSEEEWEQESSQPERASKHYISEESISANPEEFFNHLERRWGLYRPLPWMLRPDKRPWW